MIPSILAGLNTEVSIKCLDTIKVASPAVNEIILYDGKNIPFDSGSFDFVLLIDVLHHEDDHINLLKEAARVSRSLVIIKDHRCESRLDYLKLKFMDNTGNAYRDIKSIYRYFSMSEWEEMFRESGLSVYRQFCDAIYMFPVSAIFGKNLQVFFVLRKKSA